VDVLLNGMTPNVSGHLSLDRERNVEFPECSLTFGSPLPCNGGMFMCKLWPRSLLLQIWDRLLSSVETLRVLKHQACCDESAELFLLANSY